MWVKYHEFIGIPVGVIRKLTGSVSVVSVRCLPLHEPPAAAFEGTSSELSLVISLPKRLLPKGTFFSAGVKGVPEPPSAKWPNEPTVALLGVFPHVDGDAGPFPSPLPPVLLRIKPALNGFSALSSVPSLLSILPLKEVLLSSLENRPLPAGDPRLVTASLVCCRRVPGLLELGEDIPNGLEFCPIDALRPLAPSPWPLTSLFCGGGFIGELTSVSKSYPS